jgi:hypothetical protein
MNLPQLGILGDALQALGSIMTEEGQEEYLGL